MMGSRGIHTIGSSRPGEWFFNIFPKVGPLNKCSRGLEDDRSLTLSMARREKKSELATSSIPLILQVVLCFSVQCLCIFYEICGHMGRYCIVMTEDAKVNEAASNGQR